MRNRMSLHLVSFIPMVFAFSHTSSDGVTIAYTTSYLSVCHPVTGRFAVIQGLSVPECVKECGLRKHCQALHYRRRFNLCELFQSTGNGNIEDGDCLFIYGSDIKVYMNPCGDCTYGSSCDTKLERCTHQECLLETVLENGVVEGNINDKHAKIRFTCNNGYLEKNGVDDAICLESGNWSRKAVCDNECDSPPVINNGHVIRISTETASVICDTGYASAVTTVDCTDSDPWANIACTHIACGSLPSVSSGRVVLNTGNGNLYLATATVVCDDWFQTRTPTITCTSAGTWENPSDCIDCYPTTAWNYGGKTSVTVSGRPCQRWDSQVPHPHFRTQLQYFVESSIAEANNYCRNPDHAEFDPWCFTVDPLVEWEFCDVKKCSWT